MRKAKRYDRKRTVIAAGVIAAAVLAILTVIYLVVGMHFKDHFWFRTVINGVNCSGKTVADVENLITEETGSYQMELIGRDGDSDVITSTDVGLKPVFDGSLQEALESQNAFAWPVSLFRKTRLEFETMVTYEEEKLQDKIDALKCMQPANSKEPEDARISDYTAGKGYKIIPEVKGNKINESALKEVLHTSIINLQKEISLEETGCYLEPAVRADDEALKTLAEAMNSYVTAAITYTFGNEKEVLDGSTIHKWLSVSKDNQVVLDEEQIAAYVKELASRHDTYGKTRSFKTYYGSTVQLTRNEYGWKIDQAKEKAQLMEDIKAGSDTSREPVFSKRAVSFEENDYGSTYVEINITAQHMFLYKNGKMVMDTDIISGNLKNGWGTPSGAFSITYTMPGKTLRGPGYATWVDYWMPFNGGIGIHDCTWHAEFGGNIYKTKGSHGCINTPPAQAKYVFDNIKTGDPVFVYTLAGTETEKYWAQENAAPVVQLIGDIGTVTLNSANAIQAARVAYDGIDSAAQAYVKNYQTLVQAEDAYKKLLDQQNAQKEEEKAKKEAQPVINAIEAIGEVTSENAEEKRPQIEAARSQYNNLTEAAKKYVTNLKTLVAAEEKLTHPAS